MNIGVAGAGLIAPVFIEVVKGIPQLSVKCICGQEQDLEKMKILCKKYKIQNVHMEYQKLLEDDIDIVYIAVPNSLHYQFAKKALEHGKHVIVEKPFSSSYSQGKELVKLAEAKKVIVFEAISNQFLPNYVKVKELLSGLGEIKIVQMNYSQYSRRYQSFKEGKIPPVFNPAKSGGALMDINVYNIHFIVGLFGKPERIHYIANIERGIDTSGILTLEYPSFKCVTVGAKDCRAPLSINIQGDEGYIHSQSSANVFDYFVFGKNDGAEIPYQLNDGKHRMHFEVDYFINLVLNKNYEAVQKRNQHTLEVMKILDEARNQAGIQIEEDKQC